MNSMVEVLATKAIMHPDRLMITDCNGNEYSYENAWKIVRLLRAALKKIVGGKEASCVMAECNQNCEFFLLDLACELSGIVFVPVESGASIDRKNSIADETESVLWIGGSEAPNDVKGLKYDSLIDMTEELSLSDHECEIEGFPKGVELAEILYTTGTTGKSKGIMISNSANVALAENIMYGVNMKQGNTEFIPLPISHSHGLRCCYANLLNGGTIVLADGLLKVKQAFELMDKYKVTAIDFSPSAAAMIIKLSKGVFWEKARKLDYIQIGTASLPNKLKEELRSNLPNVRLYNFYGSTEAGRSCVLEFNGNANKDNCIGKATRNAQIVFANDDRNIIKATKDTPGLLATGGVMNMSGYWKNEELTQKIMKEGFVFSNDLGYEDDEGFVYVLGRRDDVINYNGIKISPEEIEEVAIGFKSVKDACCVPVINETYGQVPKLYISLSDVESHDEACFLEYMKKHVDSNKMPKMIEVISEIPRTYNGKLLRRKLV